MIQLSHKGNLLKQQLPHVSVIFACQHLSANKEDRDAKYDVVDLDRHLSRLASGGVDEDTMMDNCCRAFPFDQPQLNVSSSQFLGLQTCR
jgi:hypothetical protein